MNITSVYQTQMTYGYNQSVETINKKEDTFSEQMKSVSKMAVIETIDEEIQKYAGDVIVDNLVNKNILTGKESFLNKSKDEMSLDEYKQWVINEINQMPVSGYARSTFRTGTLIIKEQAFENMKKDPEYEKWVLDRVHSSRNVNGIYAGPNNFAYDVIGGSPEECYGYAGPIGGSSSKSDKDNDDSWWEIRHKEYEEMIKRFEEAAREKAVTTREANQKAYYEQIVQNSQQLQKFLTEGMTTAQNIGLGNVSMLSKAVEVSSIYESVQISGVTNSGHSAI